MPSIGSLAPVLFGAGALLAGLAILCLVWWKAEALGPPLEKGFEALFRLRPEEGAAARTRGMASVIGLGCVFVLVGIYLLLEEVVGDAGVSRWPRNPVPSTSQSRATGKEIYQQKCLECHGTDGYGDGPRAREFKADMDLSSHVLAHPSGELFAWINSGLGDDMPSFEDQLTEEQVWHLVNYIRTFGQDSLFGAHAH